MGKNNLYVLDLKEDQVHEDDAVFELASALSGPGVIFSGSPSEGKPELKAAYPGLFKVDVQALEEAVILPDNKGMISSRIRQYLEKETDLIITTGGMSVDPDDVTKAGIEASGFKEIHYSAAVLPGAMFLLGYHQHTAIMGLPACSFGKSG